LILDAALDRPLPHALLSNVVAAMDLADLTLRAAGRHCPCGESASARQDHC